MKYPKEHLPNMTISLGYFNDKGLRIKVEYEAE